MSLENSLEKEAEIFHLENPAIYTLVCRYADAACQAGFKRFAIANIWERIRWDMMLSTQSQHLKMPNNHRAYYARMWQAAHPELPEFFKTKRLRSMGGFSIDRYGEECTQ